MVAKSIVDRCRVVPLENTNADGGMPPPRSLSRTSVSWLFGDRAWAGHDIGFVDCAGPVGRSGQVAAIAFRNRWLYHYQNDNLLDGLLMSDRPIAPISPVRAVKPLRKLGLPRKPTPKMLAEWRASLKKDRPKRREKELDPDQF